MNELRSTEILDKEIQADARKKAERILVSAKAECESVLNSVPARIEQAKKERISKYDEKIAAFENDQKAAVPLEKERFLVSFIQESINKAIDGYVESLTEEEKLSLVLKQLTKYEKNLKSGKVRAFVYGFDTALVKKALEKRFELVSCEKTEFNKLIVEKSCGNSCKKGIILETEDRSVRCRLTFSELFSQIQDTYRKELYDALFGGRLEK